MEYPYDQPRRQSPRGKSKATAQPTQIPRAEWNPRAKRNFLEAYHAQIVAGNTLNGQNTLCSEGWRNLLRDFGERMGRPYNMDMVKNAYPKLKQEYIFVKQLMFGLTGGGLGVHGNLEMDDEWWEAKDAVTKRKASKFRNINLIPYRDLGLAIFEGKCATGEYATAPSKYSNMVDAGGEDDNDSDPDRDEGSGDSGDVLPDDPRQMLNSRNITGSSGSSGKCKRLVMGQNSQLTSCRRRLEGCEFSSRSMRTTGYSKGKKASTSSDGTPSIRESMLLIRDLEENNLPLHTYACKLIKNPTTERCWPVSHLRLRGMHGS